MGGESPCPALCHPIPPPGARGAGLEGLPLITVVRDETACNAFRSSCRGAVRLQSTPEFSKPPGQVGICEELICVISVAEPLFCQALTDWLRKRRDEGDPVGDFLPLLLLLRGRIPEALQAHAHLLPLPSMYPNTIGSTHTAYIMSPLCPPCLQNRTSSLLPVEAFLPCSARRFAHKDHGCTGQLKLPGLSKAST